jgi:hypothetical protein
MVKKPSPGQSEPVQPALPGTHDVAWYQTASTIVCCCECEACPPWLHSLADCRQKCERWLNPHRVIRGYTDPRIAAAWNPLEGRSFGENEPE